MGYSGAMSQANQAAHTLMLRRYRSQWSHLQLVFGPFLVVMGGMLLFMSVEPHLPVWLNTIIPAVLGAGFGGVVLTMPLWWKRWRARGSLKLVLHGNECIVQDGRRRQRVTGHSPCRFQFSVAQRHAGGTFEAPAVNLMLEDGSAICVGGIGTRLHWRRQAPRVLKPRYTLEGAEWGQLTEALEVSNELLEVSDARVGAAMKASGG